MSKKKIIHINPSLNVGGMETMIVQLCNHIDKEKFEVAFCSLSNDMPKAKEFNNSIKTFSLGFAPNSLRGLKLIMYFPSVVYKLGNLLKRENPDVIHIHGLFTNYLLVAIAVKLYCPNAKVIKTIHTSGLFYSSDRLIDRFRLWTEKIATSLNKTIVVGISEEVTNIAKKQFSQVADRIVKIYNGIDTSTFAGEGDSNLRARLLGNKNIIIAYVARIVDGKNHEFLIDVWNNLINRGYDSSRLIFIGAGENLEQIKHKIASLRLENEVLCLGQCSNVPDILNICDFAVFPSDYEGFSLAMIEKMAAGLPVIASDIPPFREIITTEKNGIIIPLEDKEDWIKAIVALSSDSSLRKKLSNNAIKRSKDFTVELMAKAYENTYTDEDLL